MLSQFIKHYIYKANYIVSAKSKLNLARNNQILYNMLVKQQRTVFAKSTP